MLERLHDGENRFTITDNQENTHVVSLKDVGDHSMVQMELSESAYRLLVYLQNENWLGSDVYVEEVNE